MRRAQPRCLLGLQRAAGPSRSFAVAADMRRAQPTWPRSCSDPQSCPELSQRARTCGGRSQDVFGPCSDPQGRPDLSQWPRTCGGRSQDVFWALQRSAELSRSLAEGADTPRAQPRCLWALQRSAGPSRSFAVAADMRRAQSTCPVPYGDPQSRRAVPISRRGRGHAEGATNRSKTQTIRALTVSAPSACPRPLREIGTALRLCGSP